MARETSMGGSRRSFEDTAWTVILRARDRREMTDLIRRYWKPCYFYLRRKGHDVEDAKDLTQGFFADFVSRDGLAAVTRSKGRFRSFLLACLDHFMSNEYDRRRAKKRGRPLSLDFTGAEKLYVKAKGETPAKAFLRQWAVGIMDRVTSALKEEMGPRFDALREYILAGQPGSVRDVAERLGLGESNVKVIVHRARRRYRDLLRAEVTRTVEKKSEVEDELRELFAALS